MGLFIPPYISQGHVVKGLIPYRGEAPSWPRNLLILGFVFRGAKEYPHALMTARLTVKPTELRERDFTFPRNEIGWNGVKPVTLRTDRIDIIPRHEDIFGERMEPAGFIRDNEIIKDAMAALELGLEGEDAKESVYLKLRANDCIRTSLSPDSPLVILPDSFHKRLAMNDYDYALEERDYQEIKNKRDVAARYKEAARPIIVKIEPKDIIPPSPVVEVKAASVPWWKENPELLQAKIAEAAAMPARQKPKMLLPEFHEAADLSSVTELFGVPVKTKENDHRNVGMSGKADRSKPVMSALSMRQRASQVRFWSNIFYESFNAMAQNATEAEPHRVLQGCDFKRGHAIRINPLIQSGTPKSNVGLLWNIYHNPQTGYVEALDLIVCRRSGEDVVDGIEICDPSSPGERNGFIASPHEIFRVPLTADFVHPWQSQAQPINPVFLEHIAAKMGDEPHAVYGVEAIAAHWDKEEPEIAWVTGEDAVAYQQFQMKPKTQPKDWTKKRAPEISPEIG